MPTTLKMRWPFPAENQDPWYEALEAYFTAVDLSVYASRETENLVLIGEGTYTLDGDTLAWTDELTVFAPITGFLWTMEAASLSIEDGEVLWFDATRAPSSNTVLVPKVSAQLPLSDTAILLAVRKGSTVWWRNGTALLDGVAVSPLAGGGSGGGGITGPGSSTNNAIALWSGSSGSALKNSTLKVISPSTITPTTTNFPITVQGSDNLSGAGGEVDIFSGAGQQGGLIEITAGDGSSGFGGEIDLNSGNSTSASAGGIYINVGSSANDNDGSPIELYAGYAQGTATAGAVRLYGGNGLFAAGNYASGGNVEIYGGSTPGAANGGTVAIYGGNTLGAAAGGSIRLQPGNSGDSSQDGVVLLARNNSGNVTGLVFEAGDGAFTTIKAPASVTAYTLYLPATQGAANTVLENDGSGNLSWVAGVEPAGVTAVDDYATPTDATPTTITDYTVTTDEARASVVFDVLVTMIGYGGEYATFKTLATFAYAYGSVSEVEVLHVSGPLRSNASYDLTFLIVGTQISMVVTGPGLGSKWRATGQIQLVDSTWPEA